MSRSIAEGSDQKPTEAKPKLIKLKRLKPNCKPAQGTTKMKCVLCMEQFSNPIALKEHFRKHGQESKIQESKIQETNGIPCELCPMVLPNMSAAIGHKFTKHRLESQNYSCEICGSLFPIRAALDMHKEKCLKPNSNSKIRSFDQDGSNERQENSETLNDIQSAAESTMFACKFCNATFITGEALSSHESRVHVIEQDMLNNVFLPPPSTKIRVNHNSEVYSVYYCHLCGSEYVLKFNLKKHLLIHHTIEDRTNAPVDGIIRCHLCESIFYTKKAYEAHSLNHRDDDLYVNDEEHRRKVVNRIDQDFDLSRVPVKMAPYEQYRNKNLRRKSGNAINTKDFDKESMSPPSSVSESSDEEGRCKIDKKGKTKKTLM